MRNMNRRAVMAGAVALPALSLPTIATPAHVDPIFAAIEEHRRLIAISDAAFAAVPRKDDASFPEILKSEDYAGDRQDEAFDQLAKVLTMTPATAAGYITMLHYLGEFMQKSENGCAPFHDWADRLSNPARTLISRIAAAFDGKAVQS